MPINTTGNMLMDARLLPDGTVVGRDDPRFFDAGLDSADAKPGSDEWLRRVRTQLAGIRAGNAYGSGALAGPAQTNMALRPNVAAVRRALVVGNSAGASGSANPAARGTGPVVGGPRVPGGDITGNPLMPAPGSPSGPGTNPAARPPGPTPITGNPTVTGAPAAPAAPTSGPQAPGYGSADNPAWGAFLGSGPGGSAQPGFGGILDQRAADYTAAGGHPTWVPGEKNAMDVGLESEKTVTSGAPPIVAGTSPAPAPVTTPAPAGAAGASPNPAAPVTSPAQDHRYENMLKDGGRLGKRRRPRVTINGRAMTVTDGTANGDDAVGLADGGRIPYSEYVRRNQHPDSFYRDAGQAPPADGGLPFSQAQWDALPLEQQYGNLGGDGAVVSAAGHQIAVNGTQGADGWVTVYGKPKLYGHPAEQWLDPAGLRDNGDGTFSFNPEKINGTRLAHFQQVDSDTGLGDGTHFAITGLATVIGGGLAAGAMGVGAEGAAGGAFEGATAGAEAGGNVFEGAAAGGEASGGAGLGTDVGLGSESFGGAAGEGYGGAAATPEALAQNPAVQNAFEGAVASGEAPAGSSITQWLSNPRNLLTAARLAGTLAGASSSRGDSQIPLVPGSGAPGGGDPTIAAGATGGADTNFDWERYFSDNPTANWQSVRGQFAPITDLILNEARTAGSTAEQEQAAGRASADVAQRAKRAKDARDASMISQGINPNDPRGVAGEVNRLSELDRARADVGGQNAARLAEKNRGFAVRTAAANLGNTQGAQALTADNVGLQSASTRARLGSDVANANANRRYQYTALGQTGDLARARLNADIAAGNYTRGRQNRLDTGVGLESTFRLGRSMYDSFSNGSDPFAGAGADGEVFKDGGRATKGRVKRNYRDGARVEVSSRKDFDAGGEVAGPGTSTSDSVRARLSDGEHVLNAEAVELMDAEKPGALDEMNRKGLMIRAVRQKLRAGIHDVGLGD